jgi:hypothetical protein
MSRPNRPSAFGIRQSAFVCLFAVAAISGCSSPQVIQSDGSARWSGLGVQVTLPEGTWRIRKSEKEQVATFVTEGRPGDLALFRVRVSPPPAGGKAASALPDGLAFKRLFAYFQDKKELSAGEIALPGGRKVQCAEYEVKTDVGATRVKAYAVQRDGWIYDLAEWNFEQPSKPPGPTGEPPGEKIMASLEFAE